MSPLVKVMGPEIPTYSTLCPAAAAARALFSSARAIPGPPFSAYSASRMAAPSVNPARCRASAPMMSAS